MNLLLLFESDRAPPDDEFEVTGARARHAREVLRVSTGDRLRVGMLDGPAGEGEVIAVDEGSVRLRCAFDRVADTGSALDLIVAVPRAHALRRVLLTVGALGVTRLVLLRSWRVHKPYLSSDLLQPDRYRPVLHQGMMQGRVTREPRVIVEPLFRPFVEDRAAEMFAAARRFVAHPAAATDLAQVDIESDDPVVLAIGPEGGWIPFELDLWVAAGFEPVHSGPRVMHLEVACAVLLGQVDLLRRRSTRGDGGTSLPRSPSPATVSDPRIDP